MSRQGQRIRDWMGGVDRSVTPVIATILIVALVIVIAASFGAVAFGFTDRLGSTEQASSGQCGVVEFDPENVDNFAKDRSDVYDVDCVMWFDAGSLNAEDGDTITRWNDRSASRADAGAVSDQTVQNPRWRSNVDGIDAVEFDDSNNQGLVTDATAADVNLENNTEISVVSVVRLRGSTDETFIQIGDAAPDYFRFGYSPGAPQGDWFAWYGNLGFHEPNGSIDEWVVTSHVHNGSNLNVYVDGNLELVSDGDLDISSNQIQLGYETDSDGNFVNSLDGYIAEMVVFDTALSESERKSIECQIEDKYDGSVSVKGC